MTRQAHDQTGSKLGYLSWADREELGKRVVMTRKTARMAGLAGFALLLISAIPIAALTINEVRKDTTRTVRVDVALTREVAPKRDYVLEMGVWVPRENVFWLKFLYVCMAPAVVLLCISVAARYCARRMRRPY